MSKYDNLDDYNYNEIKYDIIKVETFKDKNK